MRTLLFLLTLGGAAACGATPATDDDLDAGPDAPLGERITCAMPRRARDRAPATSQGDGRGLIDGDLWGPSWTGGDDDWVALDVGLGPTRLMTAWTAASGDAAPTAYVVETSADSADGRDGHWTTAVTVADNAAATRVHAVAFAGQRWLRLRLGGGGATLLELAAHDATQGTCDSWLFLGDSITALAFNLSTAFADDVHAARPAQEPLRLAIGEGGTNSQTGLDHVEAWLAAYPDVTNWVVSYGTNDTGGGDPVFAPAYGDRMLRLVTRLRQAGKRVFVPRIPYATWDADGAVLSVYNAQVDRVVREAGILPGPDLFAYFRAHPEQLADGVHPDGDGARAMNRLWSEVALALYP